MSALQRYDPWHPLYGFSRLNPMRPATASRAIDQFPSIQRPKTAVAPKLNSWPSNSPGKQEHQQQLVPYNRIKSTEVIVPTYHHGPLNGRVTSARMYDLQRPMSIQPVTNITSYPKFTPSDWTRRNLHHYAVAETARQISEKLRSDSFNVLRETHETTRQGQKEVDKRLGERISNITYWTYELDTELDKLVAETNGLSESRRRLDKALADTEQPVRVAQECLYFREKRQSVDLVHDNAEELLLKEIGVIKDCQEKMRQLLDKMHVQQRANRAAQHKLEQDYHHKKDAFQIDASCHVLTDTSQGLAHHPGVENINNSVTVPTSWAEFSNHNVQQSQLERMASARLRAEAEALVAACASDIWVAYNNTNVSISNRMGESLDAQRGLQTHLSKVSQEIYEMERNVELLKRAIESKAAPLKLAHTRLESRLHRPNVELCHDPPHIRLVREVRELQDGIDRLNGKLHEAETTLQQLVTVRSQLEHELKVKANSVFIDREQCLGIRKTFPYRIAYSF